MMTTSQDTSPISLTERMRLIDLIEECLANDDRTGVGEILIELVEDTESESKAAYRDLNDEWTADIVEKNDEIEKLKDEVKRLESRLDEANTKLHNLKEILR